MNLKLLKAIFLMFVLVNFVACKKDDDFVENSTQVGASKITYFPKITLNGSTLIIITEGSTFTDPGVVATVNDKPVTPVITGSVNSSTPGIYYIRYSAVNADGFTASANRIVIVKSASPVSPDYSGNWKRNAGVFGVSQWIQLTPTTYAVSDPGGANYSNFWCVVTMSGSKPAINQQQTYQQLGAALVSIATISSSSFTGTSTGSSYSWAINTPGFGTGNRTFVKQ